MLLPLSLPGPRRTPAWCSFPKHSVHFQNSPQDAALQELEIRFGSFLISPLKKKITDGKPTLIVALHCRNSHPGHTGHCPVAQKPGCCYVLTGHCCKWIAAQGAKESSQRPLLALVSKVEVCCVQGEQREFQELLGRQQSEG